MDCLEFRRRLGVDPHVGDRDAREHLQSCPFCAEAYARAQAFEARLASALSVAVPDGLADRILLAQLTGERRQRSSRRARLGWIALAAAASLVLALGVWRRQAAVAAPLSQLVAEHVTGPHERDALSRTAVLPEADVRKAFADRGVALVSVPDGVAYVSECPVGDYRTVHMVMPRGGEPVSVLYVVQHRVPASTDFERAGLRGREVPIRDGTLVMLARDRDSFGALERAWHEAIEGPPRLSAAGAP
jgi:anti-sigma factor RsiW